MYLSTLKYVKIIYEHLKRNGTVGMHTPNGPVAQPNEAPRTRMEPLAGNVHSSAQLRTPGVSV